MLERLEQICREQCKNWDIECLEFGGESDHVHLMLDMHLNFLTILVNFIRNPYYGPERIA